MKTYLRTLSLATALLASLSVGAAHADGAPPASPAPSPAATPSSWKVEVDPIFWLPTVSINSTIGVNRPALSQAVQNAISANSTVTPSQIASAINVAVSGRVEAQKDRFAVSGELFYIGLSQPVSILSRGGTESANTTLAQLTGYYRVLGDKPTDTMPVDVLVGGRYVNFNAQLDFSSSFGFNLNPGISFTDPVVGLRTSFPIANRLRLGLYGDGGFGSTTTNRFSGTFSYDFKNWDAVLGYMVINFNSSNGFRNNVIDHNVNLAGPTFGASFRF